MTKTELDALMASVAAVITEHVNKRLAFIAAGPAGPPGENGKDVDPEFVRALVTAAVDAIPKAKDGAPGARGEPGAPGASGEKGDPGESGERGPEGPRGPQGEQGAPGSVGEKGTDGAAGKDGRDGIDGRDALQIEVLPAIDAVKSYPRGTFAHHRGGIVRAFRATDALDAAAGLEAAGWAVAMNGVATVGLGHDEAEPRVIFMAITLTNGEQAHQHMQVPMLIYREVWKEGEEYDRGDVTTWGGSAWHCQAEKTSEKPGTSAAWKLMVKSGRDGRDAPARPAK